VALTRAAEKLYIITEKKLLRSGLEDFNYYSGIFISFLKDNNLWDENETEYVFGDTTKKVTRYDEETPSQIQETFISTPWKNHQIKLLANSSIFWGTSRGEAKQYGTFIHKVLSEIITKDDVKSVLHKYVQQGEITLQEKHEIEESILKIITHPELQKYYSKDVVVYNEREIVSNHQIVIPDRLVIDQENKVTVLDYKTGIAKEEHRFQLEKYASVLESLQYTVQKKILVYSNESVFIEEF
ncbi:MAG: PD-(D/E)XK nuclease family protein, partial [Flavobacteriaceae bacterium]|nr:PD-(D/E)XK nuclease family protein [Flavobacteriaceae bacterium]